jgi:UDP-N-acetylglucosamine 3-dehydrogenase
MGFNHLRVLNEFDDEAVALVGVADMREEAVALAVRRFHVAGFTDYRTMLWETQPDLVAVVVPTHLHYEVARCALECGTHVLIEKPITSTIEEGLALIRLAAQRGRHIAVGHVERFNPAVIALKRLIAAGGLGRIFCLHARRLGPFPPRIRDVGVVLDLATHDLDAMRYLVGCDVVRVHAEVQRHLHDEHEDLLFGMLRFANDVVGMLDVNWLTPTKIRELSVTGERGMFLINYLSQDLYFYENDYTPTNWEALRSLAGVSEGTVTRLKVHKQEPLRAEYEDVISALRRDEPPTVTAVDGLAVLRLAYQLNGTIAAEESVRSTA